MAVTADTIKTDYPIPVYQFMVSIGNNDIEYRFSEITGLNIEYETITYLDGMGAYHMPGWGTPVKLSLKKGIIPGQSQLYDWITRIKHNTIDKHDITISLVDSSTNPTILATWTVIRAFPYNLIAPKFDAYTNDVAIESLDLMADDLKISYTG